MGLGQQFLGVTFALLIASGAGAHELPPPLHLVTVNGAGEVSAKPDRARLSVAVERLDLDLKKAQDAVNAVVRAYLKDAKALGAKDEDITTTGVSISPEYVYPEPGRERRFSGYRVNRQVEIRITNLDKLGDYLLRATADGVTQVNPPALESTRADEFKRQALAKAAEDARAKARVLAETLGAKLGGVQRISEAGVSAPQPSFYMARAMAKDDGGNGQMGLSLGEIRFEATITADFDLLPP